MRAKVCPKCDQQVPVACKACPCGYSFFKAKKAASVLSAKDGEDRRRTQRVRRQKPNYYDSWEYERLIRKLRRTQSENEDEKKDVKVRKKKVKKEEEEEDDYANLSADKQEQCAMILEELNRKMQLVTWKPM